ncbi:MAG: hypothetical protein AB8B52_00670 [Winogradskyella sp.]|uniref:hypothetical protein n=1 Tax=Winogradskyella sp. TaxID=1883156 RepID=UPI00385EA341
MISKLKKWLALYLESNKQYPTLVAIASGLYPLVYYYNNNLLMANSWLQFIWFLALFVFIPILLFNLTYYIVNKFDIFHSVKAHALAGLNLFTFGALILLISIGITKLYLVILGISALGLMFIISKFLKKIVLLQWVMIIFTILLLIPKCFSYFSYSDDWEQLPDTIADVKFVKQPNIYIIQPDGYANFSALNKEPYNYDNGAFKTFLKGHNFEIYSDHRSNYFSTLTSNASMFAMKHHFFLEPTSAKTSYYDYRKSLAGKNNAMQILKNNNYKTFMLLDYPYIIINRPKQDVDVLNYNYNTMSYLGNTWKGKEPLDTLAHLITSNKKTNNFFFIEKILPTHIENLKSKSKGVEGERIAYFKRLEESNTWLRKMIETISLHDENGLIVLISDHGGYVGLEAAEEVYNKQQNPDLVNSIFSSLLAIKWSGNKTQHFQDNPKSNVNLFRVLFSHLSENETYLNNLEDNGSYQIIKQNAPFGVYKLIDSSGQVVFEKE